MTQHHKRHWSKLTDEDAQASRSTIATDRQADFCGVSKVASPLAGDHHDGSRDIELVRPHGPLRNGRAEPPTPLLLLLLPVRRRESLASPPDPGTPAADAGRTATGSSPASPSASLSSASPSWWSSSSSAMGASGSACPAARAYAPRRANSSSARPCTPTVLAPPRVTAKPASSDGTPAWPSEPSDACRCGASPASPSTTKLGLPSGDTVTPVDAADRDGCRTGVAIADPVAGGGTSEPTGSAPVNANSNNRVPSET